MTISTFGWVVARFRNCPHCHLEHLIENVVNMPGMVAFGRRWGIASDDLVFPGAFELFIRVIW